MVPGVWSSPESFYPIHLPELYFMQAVQVLQSALRIPKLPNFQVVATVDAGMRKRARCNHTATHLLQAALKQVLPNDVAQQGSAVTFDSLRFDFNLDRPMEVGATCFTPRICSPSDDLQGWTDAGRPLRQKTGWSTPWKSGSDIEA